MILYYSVLYHIIVYYSIVLSCTTNSQCERCPSGIR